MKIVHTSDWHLGQTFHDYDRTPEQEDMLRQIVDIVKDEQPDALVVSGDIYHTGNPAPRAVEIYNRALIEMHLACPKMAIVVTAGNHDSATRLVVNNDLWDYFSVTVVGHVAKNNDENRTPDFEKHIVEVKNASGTTVGYIAAVPHCYESNFPSFDSSLQREERAKAYFRGLLEEVKRRNTGGLPVVLMAHLAVNGCDPSGHDNIGGIDTREVEIFGSDYDYVALGHIHSPHNITDRVRYCGTPIPVNFGEKYEHSVSVVTLEKGALPEIKTRRIKNLIPLHDFPSEPAPFSEVLEQIKSYQAHKQCYLRLLVKNDESMTPLANTLVAEAVKDKQCRVCLIQTFDAEEEAKRSEAVASTLTGAKLRVKTPLEVAEMFFGMKGIELTPRLREMIEEATIRAREAMNDE